MLIIGILIGFISTYIYASIQKKLKEENEELDHARVALFLITLVVIFYLVYSLIGIMLSTEYKNSKGQICKATNYGMTICH